MLYPVCETCGYRKDWDQFNKVWYCTECDINNRDDDFEEEYEDWDEDNDYEAEDYRAYDF